MTPPAESFPLLSHGVAPRIAESVQALLASRRHLGARFTDTDDNSGAAGAFGSCSSMQGLRSIFGACVALGEKAGGGLWDTVAPDLPSLFNEWQEVLRQLGREGYTAQPYDRCNQLAEILREGRPRPSEAADGYVDSLSCVISSAVLFDLAAQALQAGDHRTPGTALRERTRQHLGEALALLLDAQCSDGGWGWSSEAEVGHLYFTWSALQGLTDLDDSAPALAGLFTTYPSLPSRLEEARRRARAFLVRRYLEPALERPLTLCDFTLDRRIEPLDWSHEHSLLYYELYLLESLLLLDHDGRERGELSLLQQQIVDHLARLRALPPDNPFWSDPMSGTLRFRLLSRKPYRGQYLSFVVQDPGLWPHCLRTLILYRLRVAPLDRPDPEIESALSTLFDKQRDPGDRAGDGLWDRTAFNLTITTRALEALLAVLRYQRHLAGGLDTAAPALFSAGLVGVRADSTHSRAGAHPAALPQQAAVTATAPSDLAQFLSHDLPRASFPGYLTEILDALATLDGANVLDPEQLIRELLGLQGAAELEHRSLEAFRLLGQLLEFIFNANLRLLPRILAESMVFHYQQGASRAEGEALESFRRQEVVPGRQPLADRIRLALKEFLTHEIEDAPRDPPLYNEGVRAIFGSPAQRGIK